MTRFTHCIVHAGSHKTGTTSLQNVLATRRTELVSGFGFSGNGCDLHGPFLGPDGRLYWTDGRHGHKVRTRDGDVGPLQCQVHARLQYTGRAG